LLTGTKVKTLNANEWETTVYLYDKDEQAIKIISKNQTLESISSVDYKLSFSGIILETKSVHNKTGVVTDLATIDEYSYDRNERLIKHQQTINNKSKELISALKYDELGKLTEKKVGGTTRFTTTGISEEEGYFLKSNSTNSWTNATLESQSGIVDNGKLEFKIRSSTGYLKIGLSYDPTLAYTQMDYALSFSNTGILRVLEQNVLKLSSSYALNDFFEIEKLNGTIFYKKNGVVFYTSTIQPSSNILFADAHFYINNTAASNISIQNYDYDDIAALQTIDYSYNIKGELIKINDVNALGNDLFALEIKRNNPTATGTPLYNGNVSQVFWKTANDNQLRYYDYSYDKLHRIKRAQFYNVDNALQDNSFNLETVNYDKNGNITFLHRAGDKMNQANLEWMDYMSYEYDGNQLTRVLEQGHNYQGHITQVLQTDTTPQYEYDANGNLTKDRNKEIENITYNNLDLPETITFEGTVTKTIQYVYDASGKKIQKIVNNDGNITITEYGNGYIYKTVNSNPTTLEYIQQAEGYIANNNGSYNYVYNHTDHLGNIRLTYTDSNNDGTVTTAEIIEENNYFPFGMKHQGYNNVYNPIGSVSYKFGFEGQEHQDDFGLNWIQFKWRNEDPALGRFFSIDPLAEKYDHLTPYQFSSNQPIHAIEVEGLESDDDLNDYEGPGWDGCYGPADGTMLNGYVGYGQYGGSRIGDEYGDDLVGEVDFDENEDDDYTWGDFKYDYLKFANRADRIAENFGKEFGKAIVSLHPGIGLWNAYEGFTKGKDLYGEELGKGGATFEAVMAVIPVVKGVKILSLGDDVVRATKGGGNVLRHYTSEAGYKAIMESGELLPSIGVKNARYGSGQYLTDLMSEGLTSGQVSRGLFGVPWNGSKVTHFIDINVDGLNTIKNAPYNYLVPGTNSLPLGGRIVNHGATIFK
jgi:RHS repeat-associated protein